MPSYLVANIVRLSSFVGNFCECLAPQTLALAVPWERANGGWEAANLHERVFFGLWPQNKAHLLFLAY